MNAPMRDVSVVDQTITAPTLVEDDGSPTWITRGSNFVVAITRARTGTRLVIEECPDEYLIFLPGCGATAVADSKTLHVADNSLLIAPPGDSFLESGGEGWILRCFSSRQTRLLAIAANSAEYSAPRPEVAPLRETPAPLNGYRLRAYHLPEFATPSHPILSFRASNLMINLFSSSEPRNVRALTPHSHEDFEQGSIALSGVWLHHIRYPWTPDLTAWRQDQTLAVGSPSVTVIPPPIIHTSRNIGTGPALLADVFAPPRLDFIKRPGMVRNSAEYPVD